MIAVDTSVVVRYLTDDPPELARRARDLVDGQDQLGLSVAVLLETAHVLRTQYDISRSDALETLLVLVTRKDIETIGLPKDAMITALTRARRLPGAPLPDALVAAAAREAGAQALASFDRGIGRHGIVVIEP